MGVRWDLAMPSREIFHRMVDVCPDRRQPIGRRSLGGTLYDGTGPGRCNCNFTDIYPFAIGPRIGGAYQLTPKTVLRAGWGLTYTPLNQFGYISYTSSLGTGWNTVNFSPNNTWDPALLLRNGHAVQPGRSLHRVSRSRDSAPSRPDQQLLQASSIAAAGVRDASTSGTFVAA